MGVHVLPGRLKKLGEQPEDHARPTLLFCVHSINVHLDDG